MVRERKIFVPINNKGRNVEKEKIVARVALNTYLSKDVVRDVINEYLRVIRKEVVETGKLHVQGFFTIKTWTKKEHERRDMITGEKKVFPESRFLKVSLSQLLRKEFHDALKQPSSDQKENNGFSGTQSDSHILGTTANSYSLSRQHTQQTQQDQQRRQDTTHQNSSLDEELDAFLLDDEEEV